MKKLFVSGLILFQLLSHAYGQKEEIIPENKNVGGVEHKGYTLILFGQSPDINLSFIQYIKDFGKTRKKNGYFVIDGPTFDGIAYVGLKVYASLQQAEDNTYLWMGYDKPEEKPNKELDESIKSAIGGFQLTLARAYIEREVDESERAVQYTIRKQNKLLREEREYNERLIDAESEKARLERALEANMLEIKVLNQKLVENKAYQDSTRVVLEKLQQATEFTKAKLKN